MPTATRVYLVPVGEKQRLVRATHPSTALMHVARGLIDVKVASQDDLIAMVAAGTKVETIAEQPEPQA